jgi:predicted GNAT family acetyltransferase
MYFWCLAGTPVCMAGVGGATTHGIKIGPVYTPPEWRRHGYASALVAAACRAELATGRIFCCLFVERHNEAARRIYRTLGFRPIVESRVYRFARPGL